MEGKTLEVVSTAKQLQMNASAITKLRGASGAMCEALALEVQSMPN